MYFKDLIEIVPTAEESKRQTDEAAKFEDAWINMDLVILTKFTCKHFDFWIVKIQTFLRYKELTEYRSNNPSNEVCNALVFDFIKQALDENF